MCAVISFLFLFLFQKAMAVQQVRAKRGCQPNEDMIKLLDFIFEEVEVTTDDWNSMSTWSGQV